MNDANSSPQGSAVSQRLRCWAFPPLRNALLATIVAAATWLAARAGALSGFAETTLFIAAIALGSFYWAREAVQDLLAEQAIGIGFLMLAAMGGSAALGMWDEAAALAVLFGLAEGVEEYTQERTRRAVRSLMALVPAQATLVVDGREAVIAARELQPGARFRVRPGERVPSDGRVVEGDSTLNQAQITGESRPIAKAPGDEVFAGSINGEGALLIEATRAFADNSVARMIHLVEEAQTQKGRAQQWIDRFGRRYTPAVLVVAALLAAVPWITGGAPEFWIEKAIVLLVAAAPCALVIATPIAMSAGIRRAGRQGVLIKGGAHLEHLGAVRAVAFDKTGTLTQGVPQLIAFEPVGGSPDEARLLALAAGLEVQSQHPLAIAVVDAARERGLTPEPVTEFQSTTGSGLSAIVDGMRWTIASAAWFEERGALDGATRARVEQHRREGRTVSLLGSEREIRAILALEDTARPEARAALEELRTLGLKLSMLSGDHQDTASRIARSLGIEDARGGLKPDSKVQALRELEAQNGPTLMVGDGINDAPALAAATCGVAMGAAGSDAAIEAADVALMAEDLRRVPLAVRIGRHALSVSRQNIVLSVAVLATMIPAALLGWIGVTTAVIVHEAAELLAVANGLRAGRIAGA